MLQFIAKRIGQTILAGMVLSFLCYFLLTLMPGDPVDMMASADPSMTAADVARLREMYGLDKPVWHRYSNWIASVVQGDLGYSRTYNIPVVDIIGPRMLNTFILTMGAILISVMIGVVFGVLAAVRQGTFFDYAVNFIAFAAFSIPAFWLAILLIIIFAVWNPILPAGGTASIDVSFDSTWAFVWDRMRYIILPMLTLAAIQTGTFARYARSAMIDALRADYIRTARAKGVSNFRVVFVHGLRNAIIPLITVCAISFGFVFSGALLTETVFSYQGMGKLLYDAIIANDFNVAMICLMLTILMVLVMSSVADILYGFADPRISIGKEAAK